MDKEDLVFFILVTVGVMVAWYWIIDPIVRGREAAPPPPTGQAEREAPAGKEPAETGKAAGQEGRQKAAPEDIAEAEQKPPEEIEAKEGLILENDLIRTYWTNRGAGLQRVELVSGKYKTPYRLNGERKELAVLQEFQEGHYSDVIERIAIITGDAEEGKSSRVLSVADSVYHVDTDRGNKLVFERTFADLIRVRKTVTLEKGTYHIQAKLEFASLSDQSFEVQYDLRGPAGIERETLDTQYLGTRVGIKEGNEYAIADLSASEIAENKRSGEIGANINESTSIAWAGVASHYFVAVNIPDDPEWVKVVESRPVLVSAMQNCTARWSTAAIEKLRKRLEKEPHRQDLNRRLNSKRQQCDQRAREHPTAEVVLVSTAVSPPFERSYRLLVAPKDDELLESYGLGMSELIYFGWFPWISEPMVAVLNWFNSMIPNYGIAIILLTILVRALLHPLTRKSQTSMAKMQKLQPKMQELQKKYADDRQKLGQEQMKLFRKYGVSPLSGCLPMLVQLPVFISLFGALRAAIELRQAGFLWIGDLSRPDTIFHLPFSLPILGDQFNVLPFLMAGAMFMNQKLMTPPSSNPQADTQRKIMKWMPLFLILILYQMPSGLTLYITTSTTIGMMEHWLIRRRVAEMKLKPVDQEDRSGKKGRKRRNQQKGKKGFFARIMEAVEEQQKQSQQIKNKDKKGRK